VIISQRGWKRSSRIVSPLGTDRFAQTGDLADPYRIYRFDAEAIIDAMAELFLN
jgi:pyruvate dehydrogenase E1 component